MYFRFQVLTEQVQQLQNNLSAAENQVQSTDALLSIVTVDS